MLDCPAGGRSRAGAEQEAAVEAAVEAATGDAGASAPTAAEWDDRGEHDYISLGCSPTHLAVPLIPRHAGGGDASAALARAREALWAELQGGEWLLDRGGRPRRVLRLDAQLNNLRRVLLHPALSEHEARNWQRGSNGRGRLVGLWRARDAIAEALLARHDELAVLLLGLLPPCVLLCISRISHKRQAGGLPRT